ncbi:MAG: Flp family type IVb pilin [Sphingomonas bacterium]|nr:Flp family type IVb pilin [Sphingomonas bacterium]
MIKGAPVMGVFKRLLAERRGAAVAEYGLIAAVAGMAIAVASLALGSAVTTELVNLPTCGTAAVC